MCGVEQMAWADRRFHGFNAPTQGVQAITPPRKNWSGQTHALKTQFTAKRTTRVQATRADSKRNTDQRTTSGLPRRADFKRQTHNRATTTYVVWHHAHTYVKHQTLQRARADRQHTSHRRAATGLVRSAESQRKTNDRA